MAVALVNGRAFDHSSIIFQWLGAPIVSLSSLDWTENQEKDFNYGTGVLAHSVGYGTKKVDVSFTISLNDVKAIEEALPTKDINDLDPSDLVITFLNPNNPHTNEIKNFITQSISRSSATDEMDIKVEFTGVATNVIKR